MEYQQIAAGWFFPAPSTDVRSFWFGCFGTVRVGVVRFSCLAHCWVLRQQGRGVGVCGLFGLRGSVVRVCVFLVSWLHCSRAFGGCPFLGGRCGGCGTGLLFENYIVDASI